MLRRNLKRLALGAAALTLAMVGGVSQANAFWGHSSGGSWGSSGGSWGSSGGSYGSYGSSGGSWGSSGGSWGSSGGSWGGRHHHHWRHRHVYYSSGSSGSWGSSGGYYVAYASSGGSSGGSYGSWGSSGGTVIESAAPMMAPPAAPAPAPQPNGPAPAPGEIPPQTPAPDSSAWLNNATLNVSVPAEAKVFVNGMATKSAGADRHYVSKGLRYGYNYSYEIRAELVRDGRTITQTKVVRLSAGGNSDVTFELNDDQEQVAEQPVSTSLTLHVPADAKVYLSGNETRGNGDVRRFSTTKLASGEAWQDYVVRVEVQRDGKTLTKEENVSLKGGEARELSFSFDAPQVAQTSLDRQ